MIASVRLTDEETFRPRPTHDEAHQLLSGLPRTQWTQALSSATEWQPAHQDDQEPETTELLPSIARWFQIETF
jgi:hypothetical protein